jgi:hypothetical protein
MPWPKAIYSVLSRKYSEDQALTILADQQQRYARLYADRTIHPQRALRMHLEDHILPGLALYQSLRQNGCVRSEALDMTQAVLQEIAKPTRNRNVWLGRLPFFFHALRLLMRGLMNKDYPSSGWETEWVELSPRLVAFNIHRCFYHETLTAYEAPELTPIFCSLDDYLYQDIWPEIKWGRTTTIGCGDAACNFRFERVRHASPGISNSR